MRGAGNMKHLVSQVVATTSTIATIATSARQLIRWSVCVLRERGGDRETERERQTRGIEKIASGAEGRTDEFDA